MTTTRKIIILQELEITLTPPEGKTENEVYDYAVKYLKSDLPRVDHLSEAGYKVKTVVNSVKIFQ